MPIRPGLVGRLARAVLAAACCYGTFETSARAQFGLAVSGVGPINRSMGGASVAAPLDAAGAIYWNPATIGELGHSEMEFGTGILIPRTTISSRLPAGALGAGVPPTSLSGNTGGNNGVFVLPAIGLVYSPTESPWSFGFGIFEIGGFGTNYPIDRRNPILNPQVPLGRGVGPLYTQYQVAQFTPTVALKLTDQFSVGIAANIDYGILYANPSLFSAPTLANSPLGPAPVYSSGMQGRARGGGGFQAGLFYNYSESWNFGASFNGPQWFDTYTWNAENPTNGNPARPRFGLNFPWTASVGAAYKGIDRLLVATDLRFMDYRDINGFRHGGFGQYGQLRGLGWQNIFALALGAQYQWTDAFSTRIGYTFNMNPIGGSMTAYNLGSPNIIQHTIAIGASYNITQTFKLSLAYSHDFQNSISGPLVQPFVGRIPGSSVRTAATADAVYLGATVSF